MKKVLISAGHSDTDPGAIQNGAREANLAKELRDLVADKLRAINKVLVLEDETSVSTNLPLVAAIKLAASADLCVEIHFNSSASVFASGVESISIERLKGFAQKLSAAVSSVLATKLRGEAGWISEAQSARGKLGFVRAGGVILEVCFISNTAELSLYKERKEILAEVLAWVISTEGA